MGEKVYLIRKLSMKKSHFSKGQHGDEVVTVRFKSLHLFLKNLCTFLVLEVDTFSILLKLKFRNLSTDPRRE